MADVEHRTDWWCSVFLRARRTTVPSGTPAAKCRLQLPPSNLANLTLLGRLQRGCRLMCHWVSQVVCVSARHSSIMPVPERRKKWTWRSSKLKLARASRDLEMANGKRSVDWWHTSFCRSQERLLLVESSCLALASKQLGHTAAQVAEWLQAQAILE